MKESKEALIDRIEAARAELNHSIDEKEDYEKILKQSTTLDKLIEQYLVAGY